MISVLDTQIANAASVLNAIERIGLSAELTSEPDKIQKSSHIIFPGVGTANAMMDRVRDAELANCLRELTQAVLGICLGMQILYEFSEEGNVPCLGLFPGTVRRLSTQNLAIPHMGWNRVTLTGPSLLMKGLADDSYFYFVHSFQAPTGPETKAFSEYGTRIPAVMERGNWFGTQFHPERSGPMGEQVLRNFLAL